MKLGTRVRVNATGGWAAYFNRETGTVTGFTAGGEQCIVKFDAWQTLYYFYERELEPA